MSDIIRLLPENVSNQIAAGEVIQRPASAVKELMENSIDSGATRIELIIKDAGKSMIKVVDNGSGMSFSDVRMCLERHATSKIMSADDIFNIRTMGFRGEALASIAAIAQVEILTRREDDETGTVLRVSGGQVETHEKSAHDQGTSISVQNLFFNTPARRNFLKSNASETRHVIDEFYRIVIAHPDISFSFYQDANEVYRLNPGNLRQRITSLMGSGYNERLVPVQESSSIISAEGYIVKPEFARKTRGEQFFFVNKRYVKDPYLNHAVVKAYEELLPPKTFPSYYIFIETDPSKIDVNIHPTKTEVKFEDERSVYSIIRAVVKRALGKFSIAPSLDFEQDTTFSIPVSMYEQRPKQPGISVNPSYNPFSVREHHVAETAVSSQEKPNDEPLPVMFQDDNSLIKVVGQVDRRYILCYNGDEVILIHQQRAHERILFEEYRSRSAGQPLNSQSDLFPTVMELNHNDFLLITELGSDLKQIGFEIAEFGKDTVVISGIPQGISKGSEKKIIEELLENYKNQQPGKDNVPGDRLIKSIARTMSVKMGHKLLEKEMNSIATSLVKCEQPGLSPDGKPTLVTLEARHISEFFK